MHTVIHVAIALVAALHLWFMVLEMFLWDTPFGRRTFRLTPEFSAASNTLAANLGLYNGFLAGGLIWSLIPGSPGGVLSIFFLVCVLVAGIYGGITVGKKILLVQALPAAIALVLLHLH
jgi:putative membrane protein